MRVRGDVTEGGVSGWMGGWMGRETDGQQSKRRIRTEPGGILSQGDIKG